jgi:hypothetical protein
MAHKRQSHLALTERLPDLRDQLTRMDDFYLEVKWEFQTWSKRSFNLKCLHKPQVF